ncbi:MAG: cytochrome bc complex cytochrome b subunit [Betaproteobacteria bacterium]|nr:MAG: cytochrome bc complex cytochrome b subunit [Betaproteobacteria bacterium]
MAAAEKQPVTITGAGPLNGALSGLLTWIDQRFPLMETWRSHLSEYYAPKNFNFWYYFGSLALFVLVIQIVTGIFLTMNYKPDASQAFASVEYIMREVPWGWWIRYMHSTGASFFFICVYLHMFRAMLYGSYRKPRELLWIFGMLIFLCLMAEAFFGYLLPWGQMSYWGAQVIVNLFDAIPLIGPDLAIWIRGADGVEMMKSIDSSTGRPLDGIPFHPYYTVKDTFGVVVFLIAFSIVVFFAPEAGGYFLEHNNFIPADPLKTPPHIAPVWYFTPYYSILRATTEEFVLWALAPGVVAFALLIIWSVKSSATRIAVGVSTLVLLLGFLTLDAKVWGVVLMGASVVIFFFLPWLDRSPVKSIRYKGPITKTAIALFVIAFFVLGYLGTEAVTGGRTLAAQVGTAVYFLFFFLMPWYSKMDTTRPEPQRVTWK